MKKIGIFSHGYDIISDKKKCRFCLSFLKIDLITFEMSRRMPSSVNFLFFFIFTDIPVVWRHFRSKMVRSRLVPGSFRKKTHKGLCVRVFSLFWKNAGNLPFFWIWTSTRMGKVQLHICHYKNTCYYLRLADDAVL